MRVFLFLGVDRVNEGGDECGRHFYSYRSVLKGRNVSTIAFSFFFFFKIFLTLYITLGYLIKNILQPKKTT